MWLLIMIQFMKYLTRKSNILIPKIPIILQHSKTRTLCHTERPRIRRHASGGVQGHGPVCPVPVTTIESSNDGAVRKVLKRATHPGKCRMCFIPEEWFGFLRPMTGVSGPYILMIGLGNYLVSKEIFVMEHEYYLGISEFIVVYYATTKFGPSIGIALDKEVDAIANELEESRKGEVTALTTDIKNAETTIWRAEGQKELIAAKKENVALQLEAIYRERQMMVYRGVRRQMEYHVKQHWAAKRIKHKWMVQWILENVRKGITPEFKKHVMEIAIRDLTVLADKYEANAKK